MHVYLPCKIDPLIKKKKKTGKEHDGLDLEKQEEEKSCF
jgi:hypothetical protein